jgi:lipopolysaccharide export system protein LptA
MALVAAPVGAAPPPPMTTEEIAALEADTATKAPVVEAAQADAQKSLATDLEDSRAASEAATNFLAQNGLPPVNATGSTPTTEPLKIDIGENITVIESTGGMYFDGANGVLVYLKNVTVKDPRFSLTGADELRIFFGKKSTNETAKADPADKPKTTFGGNIGDVERIVATGAVKITQKAVDGKEPIVASGAIFSYNVKADQIILKGGYPWFTQGTTFMRAMEPNLVLRISPKTGTADTEGNWEMGGELEQKR